MRLVFGMAGVGALGLGSDGALPQNSAFILMTARSGSCLAGIVGFGMVGFSTGDLAPLVFSAAAWINGRQAHHTVPAVVGVGYAGFLAGPMLIGLIANHLGLGTAAAGGYHEH